MGGSGRSVGRGFDRRAAIRAELRRKYPVLTQSPAPFDTSAIVLGRSATGNPLLLPERVRLEHGFAIGTTGGGKSKFLEHCIRQDIASGRGVLVIDPHGEHPDSLYRSVLSWMKARGYLERRRVHLIDPNDASHVVGFNPLARTPDTELSVIAAVTLEAFARAWGGEDTSRKPTIERVLTATFAALAELGLSLAEAPMLLDRADAFGLRRFAADKVRDSYARAEMRRLHELSQDDRRRQDFDIEVLGPINRLARFLRPAGTAAMMGQTTSGLDFGTAFDEGDIILCNLSGSNRIYEADADLLGRLITRFAFFHAKRRRRPERPFFIYMDECHRYLSGDLENILAESRKYGVGVMLATQWLEQLRKESENMLAAVLNATNVKIVFRIKDPQEAEQLAETVIPLDLEIPVRTLIKPAVVGYRRTRMANGSRSEQASITDSIAETSGWSVTESRSESVAETTGTSESATRSDTITSGSSESAADTESQTHSWGASRTFGFAPGDADASAATGNTVREAAGTYGKVSMFSPARYLLGGARDMSAVISNLTVGDSRQRGEARGRARQRGTSHSHAQATSTQRGSSHSVSHSVTEGIAHTSSESTTAGRSHTRGEGLSEGWSESLEPVLEDRPSAVHGRDNVRYMAGQFIRRLPTGKAVVSYVGRYGMVSAFLTVPLVSDQTMSPQAFAGLRSTTLARSGSAIPADEAAALQERRLRAISASAQSEEIPEPESFRTEAPPSAPERGRSRPAAAGRRKSRPSSKKKSVE